MNKIEEHSANEIRIKRSIFWKIYFWLIVCVSIGGLSFTLSHENSGLIEIIDIPMVLIATIGLFGYVFSKRIYKQSFWICFFGAYLAYSLVSPFLSEIESLLKISQEKIDSVSSKYDEEIERLSKYDSKRSGKWDWTIHNKILRDNRSYVFL